VKFKKIKFFLTQFYNIIYKLSLSLYYKLILFKIFNTLIYSEKSTFRMKEKKL